VVEELERHHQVQRFQRRTTSLPILNTRINRLRFARDLDGFLARSDVALFEWASELLAAASRRPKRCGIVTRLHRYELYRWSSEIAWDAVDKIIVVSEAKKHEFARRFPAQVSKLEVVYEAVDPERFPLRAKTVAGDIGILCHLTPRKRVYELILVFYELSRKRPDLHLHIGGGEHGWHRDYFAALHDLVDKLRLSDRVTFYGPVDDAAAWYRNVDLFVSNAYSEGLQVSALEAMASGCFCLSHRWPGAEEMLADEHLYLTDRELEEKIADYFDLDQPRREQQCAAQRDRVLEQFNLSLTARRIREILEEVGLGGHGR
jgi:glycosyltransferase involved in cell wall biosynthesis